MFKSEEVVDENQRCQMIRHDQLTWLVYRLELKYLFAHQKKARMLAGCGVERGKNITCQAHLKGRNIKSHN